MKLFIRWLEQTFPDVFVGELTTGTQSNGLVLDVAGGGKGELATRLAWCYQLNVMIIDPRPTNAKQCFEKTVLRQLPKKWQERARERGDEVDLVLERRIRQLQMYFTYENTVLKHEKMINSNNGHREQEFENDDEMTLISGIQNASLLVGMHADSATEAIVDAALYFGKPFCVVPCCVFPNFFPKRIIYKPSQTNKQNDSTDPVVDPKLYPVSVRSYPDFCEYLLKKDSRFQSFELPFPGRNLAIWWNGK